MLYRYNNDDSNNGGGRRVSPRCPLSASSSSHEESPHLVLRPTAPACAWKRLELQFQQQQQRQDFANKESLSFPSYNDSRIRELILIGWSYPTVLDKLLPLFHRHQHQQDPDQTASEQDRQQQLLLQDKEEDKHSNDITSKSDNNLGNDKNIKSTNHGSCSSLLFHLESLNIISTELWISNQLRSPFTLGVDGITGSLLVAPCCWYLETLVIARAVCGGKTESDWQSFCTSLRHLLHLKRLELCDAANVYLPTATTATTIATDTRTAAAHEQARAPPQQRQQQQYAPVDLSVLFETMATSLPSLQVLKLHLNTYSPGKIPLPSWFQFASSCRQLKEISLHMVHFVREQPHHVSSCASSAWSSTTITSTTTSSTASSCCSLAHLSTLHLTMVEFDSNDTWNQVLLTGRGNGRHHGPALLDAPTLHTLTLTSPSMTDLQYRALWSRLFLPVHQQPPLLSLCSCQKSSSSFSRLQQFHACIWHTCSLLSLKGSDSPHSLGCQVQPRLRQAMLPSLSYLLDCWRTCPPLHLHQCRLPWSYHGGVNRCRTVTDGGGVMTDHPSHPGGGGDWRVVRKVYKLYQSLLCPRFNHHDLEQVLDLMVREGEETSLDCLFHLVSFCVSALFSASR